MKVKHAICSEFSTLFLSVEQCFVVSFFFNLFLCSAGPAVILFPGKSYVKANKSIGESLNSGNQRFKGTSIVISSIINVFFDFYEIVRFSIA